MCSAAHSARNEKIGHTFYDAPAARIRCPYSSAHDCGRKKKQNELKSRNAEFFTIRQTPVFFRELAIVCIAAAAAEADGPAIRTKYNFENSVDW